MSILMVEDDAALARTVQDAFAASGVRVEAASSAEEALAKLGTRPYDAMLLDVGLPGVDGFELLRRLREQGHGLPVLIVSGQASPRDRLRGFDLGADDYVTKPFLVDELRARVRAVTRRARSADNEPYRHGPLEIDLPRRLVRVAGNEVELTRREWTILELLLRSPGQVLDKRRLASACSSGGETLTPNAVEVYVSRLRAKIEAAGDFVRTVRGYGYLWNEPEPASELS